MNSAFVRRAFQWIAAGAAAVTISCKGPGQYIWVDSYAESGAGDKTYLIVPGDLLQVRVFNQDQLTTRARVRVDGKVSLPLVKDVPAAGRTPALLTSDLELRYKEFVKTPLVTVSVEEARPAMVYVGGEVTRPSAYPIESCSGVLQALVTAGGLTVNARSDLIFVLRDNGASNPSRIRFTYDALVGLHGRAHEFRLRPGDVVIVE